MDELKISDKIEKELDQEDSLNIKEAITEDINKEEVSAEGKTIVIAIVVIFGIFVLSLGGFKLYGNLTSAQVIDIDQLHQNNLNGELNEKEGYIYNGFSFIKVDGLWWTEVKIGNQNTKIPLHFGPKDVEQIPLSGSLSENFAKTDTVYISIDPEVVSGHYVVAMRELSANVAQGLGRNSAGACSKENDGCEDREILNCEDTKGQSIIQLEESNQTSIQLSGTCVKIKGQDYEIIKAANKVLYMWYGVIK
jgi:hypothetical protein